MPPPMLRPLLRSTPTVAPVPNRSAMSISGSQAGIFLNGMLSSAVQEPMKGPLYSSFLHAQGRVLYDVFLYTRTEANGKRGYVLEYDARPSEAKVLFPMLKRYVLRAKVKIRDVTDDYDVWAAWGNPSHAQWDTPRQWKWAASGVAEPVWDPEVWPWGQQDESILDRRATGMGRRFLVKKGERPQEAADHDIATSDDYTLHRILHGVPEGREDMPAMQAFPMDSNLDFMGGIDFRKGCYVGQELTVRTYYTGVIRKRILPVVIHKPDQVPNEIVTPSSTAPKFPVDLDIRPVVNRAPDDPRPVPRPRGYGKLLSSRQGVGLALLRLEHVDAAQKGDLRLEFDVERGESKGTWGVSHWWPDWWPQRSEADKKEARG